MSGINAKALRDVIVALALAAAVLWLPSVADARPCRGSAQVVALASGCANGVCRKPAAVQKVVEQVVVEKVVEKPVVVERVVEHVAQPAINNVFYGVGNAYSQQAMMAAAVKDAMSEYAFNATVQGTIQGSIQGAGAAPVRGGYQQPVYSPPPQQQPPTFSLNAPPQALNQHCAGCHAGGQAKGGFNLQDPGSDWKAAVNRILDGSMPPNSELDWQTRAKAISEITNQ